MQAVVRTSLAAPLVAAALQGGQGGNVRTGPDALPKVIAWCCIYTHGGSCLQACCTLHATLACMWSMVQCKVCHSQVPSRAHCLCGLWCSDACHVASLHGTSQVLVAVADGVP